MLRLLVLATFLVVAGSALANEELEGGGSTKINKITDFTVLGEGGNATINPGNATINAGLYTTDGSGTITLHTGTDPASYGTVTFVLNSNTNRSQPCVLVMP